MQIIGLCGYAGVGKDTAARHMDGWKRYAFADCLKSDLVDLGSLIGLDVFNLSGRDKEVFRPMFVAWGATARAFIPDFWIFRMFENLKVNADENAKIVITDVRYPNEVDAIQRRGGKVIRIRRHCFGPANDEEARSFRQIEKSFALEELINNSSPESLGIRVIKAFQTESEANA
jgi:hypothetical protein